MVSYCNKYLDDGNVIPVLILVVMEDGLVRCRIYKTHGAMGA